MKAKFGSFIVAGSGKIGGHVVSKNKGGSYVRTKVTPSNPNSSAQQASRALLASLSTAWAGLTDEQRASWNGAVNDFSSTDVFGDLRNPSGINLFVKLNANLSNTGQAMLTVAPTKIEVPFFGVQSVVVDLSTTNVTTTLVPAPSAFDLFVVRASAPMSAGISNAKSKMRVIYTGNLDGSGLDLYTAYVAKFGVPPIGGNLFFSVQSVVATGQAGVVQTVKTTVIA
jgi:hypothetical protein